MTRKTAKRAKTPGFTLIELLVVIAILGILMGLTVPKIAQMMGTSREHKCRNNMKQLHTAVMSYVLDNNESHMPRAMSYEYFWPGGKKYYERPGWVRWVRYNEITAPGSKVRADKTYKNIWHDREKPAEPDMVAGMGMGELERDAIEFGTIFTYMNNDLSQYACPVIKREIGNKPKVYRTYAMNMFFFAPEINSQGLHPADEPRHFNRIGTNEGLWDPDAKHNYQPEAAKLLLFAEIEPEIVKDGVKEGRQHASGSDAARGGNDRQIRRNSGSACFDPTDNRLSGGGDAVFCTHKGPVPNSRTGLVVFLDGHIDTLVATASGKDDGNNGVVGYTKDKDGIGGKGRYSAEYVSAGSKIKHNIGWYLVRGIHPEM